MVSPPSTAVTTSGIPPATIPRAQLVALHAIRRAALAHVEAPYLDEHLPTLKTALVDYYERFEKR